MHRKPFQLALASLRLSRLFLHMVYAFGIACVYPALSAKAQGRFMQRWSRGLLNLLNVRHKTGAHSPGIDGNGYLLVANHVSWLDIFAINAAVPARFVAKSEVSSWPVVGWLVRRAGTLFIRRNVRRDTARVNALIVAQMQRGHTIAVFAQGTSTDGAPPVHFHSSLLQAAIDAQAVVHPVAVHYHDEHGNRLNAVAFIGDTGFLESLWQIVCVPCIYVTTVCLPAIHCAGQGRRSLALQAQHAVNAALAELSRSERVPVVADAPIHAVT